MTGGAPRIFDRRRRRRFMVGGGGVGGVRPDERALKQRTRRSGVFFSVLQGSATSPVISAGQLAPNNSEYACPVQFHSLNELFTA